MGGYCDQPLIILEELRADEGFTYKELLMFLDPYTQNATKSRYYDKYAMADYIIVTSVLSPIDYYQKVMSAVSSGVDSAGQLYRRISQVWHVKPNTVESCQYDLSADKFVSIGSRKNPVPDYLAEITANEAPRKNPLDVLAQISDKFDSAKRQISLFPADGAEPSASL